MFQCTDCLVPTIVDSINSGVIHNWIKAPTKNSMHMDDNFLVDIWDRLKIALGYSIESLYDILGYQDESLRKSPLSSDKYFESLYSYNRKTRTRSKYKKANSFYS